MLIKKPDAKKKKRGRKNRRGGAVRKNEIKYSFVHKGQSTRRGGGAVSVERRFNTCQEERKNAQTFFGRTRGT